MAASALSVIGILVAAGGSAASGLQTAQTQKSASNAAAFQRGEQDRLAKEAKRREQDQKKIAEATIARDIASQRTKQQASLKAGRSGTIVTGPLGVPSSASQAGAAKTLIGG